VERGLLAGLAAFRWAAWTWMAAVLLVNRDDLGRPWLAVVLVGLALAVTAAATVLVRTDPPRLLTPGAVAVELAVGAALLVGDGAAYPEGHAFAGGSQNLGSAWPVAGVLAAGIVLGWAGGAGAGLALGLARLGGVLVNGPVDWDLGRVQSVVSSAVLFALAGGAAGFAAERARAAEREVAGARAREDVARHLHDGVLQTLAVVQRRSDDADLVRLAHEQERELRAFLATGRTGAEGGLEAGLRAAAARFEDAFGGRAEVVVAPDVPALDPRRCEAVVAAAGEALTNAGKHGGAARVTVYAEPADDGGVWCWVHDDGAGFDPAAIVEGVGLPRSIRGRLEEVGGRASVSSAPGRGTEVGLWVPA
jgi:signal transduction histidine kinase